MGHAADFRGISLIHKKAVLSSLLPGMSTIEDTYWAGTVYSQCILCSLCNISTFYVACVTSPSFLYEANTKRKRVPFGRPSKKSDRYPNLALMIYNTLPNTVQRALAAKIKEQTGITGL